MANRDADTLTNALESLSRQHNRLIQETIRVRFLPPDFIDSWRRAASRDAFKGLDRTAELSKRLAEQMKPIFERAHGAWLGALPDNWSEAAGDDFDKIEAILLFMEETGWSLVWVPRPSIIEELLATDGDESRAACLLAARAEIIEDLSACVASLAYVDIDLRLAAQEAIDAFNSGLERAAQALATNTFTTSVAVHLDIKRDWKTARKQFRKDKPMEVGITRLRIVAILQTAALALDRYTGADEEPIPIRFNRHASTHRVSAVQYTTVNALVSLMLVVSLLRELDVLLQRQADRRTA